MSEPTFNTTIKIPKDEAAQIRKDLRAETNLQDIADRYKSYETTSWSAYFEDGVTMDINLCCDDIRDLDSNPLWTEAVLFENGREVDFTEPCDKLFGKWELETEQAIYQVFVEEDEVLETSSVTVFFDMDNVMNILEHTENGTEEEKPFNNLCHYFQNLQPNKQIQELTQTVSLNSYLLGHITERNMELMTEHLYDKIVWMKKCYPGFPTERIIFVPKSVSKSRAVYLTLGRKIGKYDILIDDYNPNLVDWQKSGGTAIKYINKDNTRESFNGPYITKDMDISSIYETIRNAVMKKKGGGISMFTKLETPILAYLTIGDWSEDGHGSWEKVYFKVNYPVEAIQQAYKDSCRKTGVQFNHNENYTGTEQSRIYDQIWTEYNNDAIRPAEGKILREYGVITDEYMAERGLSEEDRYIWDTDSKDAADIIMRFIALSMPKDFCYTEEKIAAQPINGWWNPNLNCQFGYGLYE